MRVAGQIRVGRKRKDTLSISIKANDAAALGVTGRQNLRWINFFPVSICFPTAGRGRRTGVCSLEAIMKLLRTTALTAALMTAAIPLLTSDAQAWRGWRGGGWRGAAVGAAVVGGALAARSYYGGYGYGYPSYGYGTGYSYPSYGYGYGTGYSYPSYGYGYGRGIVRRGLYAAARRHW